jgi:zinc transporter
VHLNRDSIETHRWLQNDSGLDPIVVESLLAENTRPRSAPIGDGAMVFLRGVNLNPGAEPEDMVSIRLWVEARRIISVRLRRLRSVDELRRLLAGGTGPVDTADFIGRLSHLMVSHMADVIDGVDDRVDELQQQVLATQSPTLRSELTGLRHEIIALRRYLSPQREALARLSLSRLAWLDDGNALRLREESDRVTRYVEDLDAARERAAVTSEELDNRLSEQLNRRMYVLSVVAAVFLPLGFLTGLFGINVGGIPLADDPWGFVEVTLLLLVLTLIQVAVFRWRRWF